MRKPCPTCPWRVDKHADTIPGFRIERAERLTRTTTGEPGAPVMACHQSDPLLGQRVPCAGWLVRHGWANINVRLLVLTGELRREELEIGEDWPELHETYEEVLAKLREDVRVV